MHFDKIHNAGSCANSHHVAVAHHAKDSLQIVSVIPYVLSLVTAAAMSLEIVVKVRLIYDLYQLCIEVKMKVCTAHQNVPIHTLSVQTVCIGVQYILSFLQWQVESALKHDTTD